MKALLIVLALSVFTTPVLAASKTVRLSMPSMDCPVCPITVKKALSKVAGDEISRYRRTPTSKQAGKSEMVTHPSRV